MPQVSAAVLRSTPSSTSASASIRRAAALSFSPLAALRSSEAVRSSRVIDTAAPIDAAPLKGQHRVRVSLIWESLMSHSFGPLVLEVNDDVVTVGSFLIQLSNSFSVVIVRESGRSSIPETSALKPRGRSVLDAPHARGMTVVEMQ